MPVVSVGDIVVTGYGAVSVARVSGWAPSLQTQARPREAMKSLYISYLLIPPP